jgi:hypothetical protein
MRYPSIGNQKRGKDAPLGRTGSKFQPCEGNKATSLVPVAAVPNIDLWRFFGYRKSMGRDYSVGEDLLVKRHIF